MDKIEQIEGLIALHKAAIVALRAGKDGLGCICHSDSLNRIRGTAACLCGECEDKLYELGRDVTTTEDDVYDYTNPLEED